MASRAPKTPRVRSACLLLAGGLVLATGCGTRAGWQAGIPGAGTPVEVERVAQRGDYLDAWVVGDAVRLRTFAPRTEACVALLSAGRQLQLRDWGAGGQLAADGEVCNASGIGSLDEWRRRRGRVSSPRTEPLAREPADFEELYRDDELILLRGRFPLAAALGWAGGYDTIAAIPNTEPCRDASRGGHASMELVAGDDEPLVLLAPGGRCAIAGLIRPTRAERDPG